VRQVTTRAELRQYAAQLDCSDGVLVQQPAIGPPVMVQSVFANGELVAFHACERVREGTGVDPVTAIPAVAATLATLIRPAAWRHFAAGATSAYSLSPAAWQALLETAQQPEFTHAGCASPAYPAGGAVQMATTLQKSRSTTT
jgi:hypothetical protein